MGRVVVQDRWGVRWTVRARYDRHLPWDTSRNRRAREPELQASLGPALDPRPGRFPYPDAPPCGSSGYDEEHSERARFLPTGAGRAETGSAVGPGWGIWSDIRLLRTWSSDHSWVVDLHARGRIRRGATWRVATRTDAERVAGTVADAVRWGQVPQPDGALLVDVLDQRLTVYGAPR